MNNPNWSNVPPATIAVQRITRTTVVMENPSFSVPPNNGKENSKSNRKTGKQDRGPSPNKPNEEEQLRTQFQSASGPPKKRLSPKQRSPTNHGGKFGEHAPIRKRKHTNSTSHSVEPPNHTTQPNTRPSQSFEKGVAYRNKLRSARNALQDTNAQCYDRYDSVNAALYPSQPPNVYYTPNHYGTHRHEEHLGLKVHFVDDVPRTTSEGTKPTKVYKFGHIPVLQPTGPLKSLVSLNPKHQSCATGHGLPSTMPNLHLRHPESQQYFTSEMLQEHMTGPLIRTPESFYYKLYGPRPSAANSQVPVPIHSFATQPSTSSTGPNSEVSFAQPVALSNVPRTSASKPQVPVPVPVPVPVHATKTQPTTSLARPKVCSTQPAALFNMTQIGASKPQVRLPVHSNTQHSTTSVGPDVCFTQPAASSIMTQTSVSHVPLSVPFHSATRPFASSAVSNVCFTRPIASSNMTRTSVSKPQALCTTTPKAEPTPKKSNQTKAIQEKAAQKKASQEEATEKEVARKQALVHKLMYKPVYTSRPCKCTKSQCLKLYCYCFETGGLCAQACKCKECKNNIRNFKGRSNAITQVLKRNPAAFQPKK
ncbi:MAG: hypothetical protein SGBAC_001074 [Bacillariaceae sp.]